MKKTSINGLAGLDVIGIQCVNTLQVTTIEFFIINCAATVFKYAQKQCKNAHMHTQRQGNEVLCSAELFIERQQE